MEKQTYQKEEEVQLPAFLHGFNTGYLLAEFEPEFLEKTLSKMGNPVTSHHKGMIWGKKQFEKERQITQLNEFDKIRNRGIDRDRDKER